jgi:ribonuclease-3
MKLNVLRRLRQRAPGKGGRGEGGRRPATAELEPLADKLGHAFADPSLLRQAVTHSTYANEHPGRETSNERLEFLGDAVVDLLATEILFKTFRREAEGALTARRARVVRWESLALLAQDLGLASFLRLGQGESRAPVAERRRLLADAYEAVVGAVFLDGGFEAVRQCFGPALTHAIDAADQPMDFKSLAQEACHRAGLPPPVYRVVAVSGPDHAREYTCELTVGDEVLGRGQGSSKKTAEQESARGALGRLEAR